MLHIDDTVPVTVTTELRDALEVATAETKETDKNEDQEKAPESMQMKASNDPKTQKETKEKLLRLKYRMDISKKHQYLTKDKTKEDRNIHNKHRCATGGLTRLIDLTLNKELELKKNKAVSKMDRKTEN